jgi:hypothetical protein
MIPKPTHAAWRESMPLYELEGSKEQKWSREQQVFRFPLPGLMYSLAPKAPRLNSHSDEKKVSLPESTSAFFPLLWQAALQFLLPPCKLYGIRSGHY